MARGRPIDVGKLASAASRPGIDPRVWLTFAVVTELGFDAKEGVFADVKFVPGGETETAYFGTSYAGNGFGEHNPLHVDDYVLVAVPMGDPGQGCVVVARINSKSDPPPSDFGDGEEPSMDRVLIVEPGQNLIIKVAEGAKVSITASKGSTINLVAEDVSTVNLGAEGLTPLQTGALNGEAIDPFTGKPHFLLGNASKVVNVKKEPSL